MLIRRNPLNDVGQISIDYIIGVSIFIITFFFLYSILDSLFLPLQANSDEVQPMAERVSSNLIESTANLLADDSSIPNIINETKAEELNLNLSGSQYEDKLSEMGLNTTNLRYNLNVSLRYFNDTLYPNASNATLNGGSIPDESTKVGQIVRFVCLQQDPPNECKRLKLVVRVWL
jgi:hypothetical protein